MDLSLKFNHFAKSALVVAPSALAVAATIYNSGLEAIFMSAAAGAVAAYVAFGNRVTPESLPPQIDEAVITNERLGYLAKQIGLSKAPSVYVVQHDSVKAHCINGEILITSGLLETFPNEEVEAIIVHEMAHAYRKDNMWQQYESKAVSYSSFAAVGWNANLIIETLKGVVNSVDAQNLLLSVSAVFVAKAIGKTIRSKQDDIKMEYDCDKRAVVALESKSETISALQKIKNIVPSEYFRGSDDHPAALLRIQRVEGLNL